MTEIKSPKKDLLKNLELDVVSNKDINSDISSLNKESINLTKNNGINKPKNNLEIFGDLTSIIQNKIRLKTLSKNNITNNRNKSDIKNNSALLTFDETKRKGKEKSSDNLNIHTNINNINLNSSTTKDNSQISINSNKIKTKKKKINPELFINKRNQKDNKNINKIETISIENPKKFNCKSMLDRFEEEQKKASKKFENKKQEIIEQEKRIYTGKPSIITKPKLKNNEKYSKDFLTRQKELNDDLIKKKKKLIEENNKKKEEEYKLITTQNIWINKNKNKKNYFRNKSSDHWVERLYTQDTKKRKLNQYYLNNAFIPSFKPEIERKNIKNVLDKNKMQINKVLKDYEENTNPELIINYLNINKNTEDNNEQLFRNKIFGKSLYKYTNKKINNSIG